MKAKEISGPRFVAMLTVFGTLVFSPTTKADFMRGYSSKSEHKLADHVISTFGIVSYIFPNESYPQDAKPLFERAPGGVYIAVGADRGFNNASLTPRATHLLLLDQDPNVVAFNRINIGLLQMAHNRQDYLMLRKDAMLFDWTDRIAKSNLEPSSRDLIGNAREYVWWNEEVQESGRFADFHRTVPVREKYEGANYLLRDDQFERIQKMAKEGRISSHIVDLSKAEEVAPVVQFLSKKRIPLAVVDLSNAFMKDYIGAKRTASLLKELEPLAGPPAIAIVARSTDGAHEWTYAAYTFDHISRGGELALERDHEPVRAALSSWNGQSLCSKILEP